MTGKGTGKPVAVLLSALLIMAIGSCGRYIDNPDELKEGYRFKSGKVMYRTAKFVWGWDSTRYTIDSFEIREAVPETDYVVIAMEKPHIVIVPPVPQSANSDYVHTWKTYKYGFAHKNGLITVFPQFDTLVHLVNDLYVIGSHHKAVVSARGILCTDIKYSAIHLEEDRVRLYYRLTDTTNAVDSAVRSLKSLRKL